MPVILQGHCSSCGYRSPTISESHYGGVIVDDPSTVRPCDAHPADNRVVVLGHPIEQEIIEEYGHTYLSATIQGRYLSYKEYFCKACGQVYEVRKLAAATFVFGCLPPIVIGLTAGIGIGCRLSSVVGGLIGFYAAALFSWVAIDWLVGVCVRIRHADRAREFQIDRVCPQCGSRRAATSGTLPCPGCKQRSMKVTAVGIS